MKNRKRMDFILTMVFFFMVTFFFSASVYADSRKILSGKIYDLGVKDKYEISKAQDVSGTAERFRIEGDISSVDTNNGIVSYAINSGNLNLMIDDQFGKDLFESKESTDWHIVNDKSRVIDNTKLSNDSCGLCSSSLS